MPRLIPRLLKKLAEQPLSKATFTNKHGSPPRQYSFPQPSPSRPSFNAKDYTRSILLNKDNPITHANEHRRHKSLPPSVSLSKTAEKRKGATEGPREMSREERSWWASPYLRMLGSPLRRCRVTNRSLPSHFLVRLGQYRIPDLMKETHKGTTTLLAPDGLESSRFRVRRAGRAMYVVCWKHAMEEHLAMGGRMLMRSGTHPALVPQTSHLLRLRVLQELELLAERMTAWPNAQAPPPILRRLTRKEFQDIKDTGRIPFKNAVAVLVVPPVNNDPQTRQRATLSMESTPLPGVAEPAQPKRPALPVSVLLPSGERPAAEPSVSMAEEQIPLYNGASLFPLKPQRAALHDLLCRVLAVERRARDKCPQTRIHQDDKPDSKASHAFVLFSGPESVLRADTVPLAIALWRIRLFEGADWDDHREDSWILKAPYLSMDVWEP